MQSNSIRRLLATVVALVVLPVAVSGEPLQVFLLAGQSNMQGKAAASTLEPLLRDKETRAQFRHLKVGDDWTVRDDVWVTYLDREETPVSPRSGALSVGFGDPKRVRSEGGKRTWVAGIGPELGIGHVLGDHLKSQVLLIKAAWGGRALKHTFRPPSAAVTDAEVEAALARRRKKQPEATFDEVKKTFGSDYRKMLAETQRVLADLPRYVPGYDAAQGYQWAGVIWFQGWNDGVGRGNPHYTEQLAHFVRDVRRDLGAPQLPFVIGELGIDGPDAGGWIATFRQQQRAVADMPEFRDSVRFAPTAAYWHTGPKSMEGKWEAFRRAAKENERKLVDDPERIDPGTYYQRNWQEKYARELAYTSDRRYHYHGSGRCYYQMGESMGRAMIELLRAPAIGSKDVATQ